MKFHQFFEALPIDPKSLKGRGVEAISNRAQGLLYKNQKERANKIGNRVSNLKNPGITRDVMEKISEMKNPQGSSRIVFASDKVGSVIKIAKSKNGVEQNVNELKFIKHIQNLPKTSSDNLKKMKSLNKDYSEFVPKILSVDTDSDYARRGFPIWIEFERLKPLESNKKYLDDFAKKYGFYLRNHDTYYPYYIPSYGRVLDMSSFSTFQKMKNAVKKNAEKFLEKTELLTQFVINNTIKVENKNLFMINSDKERVIDIALDRTTDGYKIFTLFMEENGGKPFQDYYTSLSKLFGKQFKRSELDKANSQLISEVTEYMEKYFNELKKIEPSSKLLFSFMYEIKKFGLSFGETTSARQWGIDRKGNFKLLDYGLDSRVFGKYYG